MQTQATQTQAESLIQDPYIAVEFTDTALHSIRESLQRALASCGVATEKPERDAHISLGYGLGCETENRIKDLAQRVAASHIELRVVGVEVLAGLTTPYDYVVLVLEENDVFRRVREQIESELVTKSMPGGLHVHTTLLRVPKNSNAESDESLTVARAARARLQEACRPLCGRMRVRGEKVAVFDREKCCRLQCPMPAA
ncbi:MAG: hypothetical protein NDI61_04460 [Bdellovibrionaceae bacterium]|nr:hypothetical protein [Pseudobdellovibrionaceae bacterium]